MGSPENVRGLFLYGCSTAGCTLFLRRVCLGWSALFSQHVEFSSACKVISALVAQGSKTQVTCLLRFGKEDALLLQVVLKCALGHGVAPGLAICAHLYTIILDVAVGSTILTEATLSFLGLGVKYPFASWGNIINDVNNISVLTNYWFIWIPAGVCLLSPQSKSTQWGNLGTVMLYIVCHMVDGSPSTRFLATSPLGSSSELTYATVTGTLSTRSYVTVVFCPSRPSYHAVTVPPPRISMVRGSLEATCVRVFALPFFWPGVLMVYSMLLGWAT